VFSKGWFLVHGVHPSLTPTLLSAAEEYKHTVGQPANLVLVVSRAFSKAPKKNNIDINRWQEACSEPLLETPESTDIGSSLEVMRQSLVEQSNVLVAIGGRWWEEAQNRAGVPKEIEIARGQDLPCFLLGSLGGATADYLESHPEILRKNKVGLDANQQLALFKEPDISQLTERVIDQIGRLPLHQRSEGSGRRFRILCLDGGGIRGAYTASALQHWETISGLKTTTQFDLICGTSTGGILAIALGLGIPASEIVKFYQQHGPKIFAQEEGAQKWMHTLRHWFTSKYDQENLRSVLEEVFNGNRTDPAVLDNSSSRLVIPYYNEAADLPRVFRTSHLGQPGAHPSPQAVQVALATSAAPTYFQPVSINSESAIDGGIWANSPSIAALAEAVGKLGIEQSRIEILSVGTTYTSNLMSTPLLLDKAAIASMVGSASSPLGLPTKILSYLVSKLIWKPTIVRGKIGYAANIAGLLMKAQAQATEYTMNELLEDRHVRVDCATDIEELDSVAEIPRLIALGRQSGEVDEDKILTRFFNGIPASRWSQ